MLLTQYWNFHFAHEPPFVFKVTKLFQPLNFNSIGPISYCYIKIYYKSYICYMHTSISSTHNYSRTNNSIHIYNDY
ncbi:hypothetical protein HanIR_Chr16g0810891 [Helianthus annuus]|nr:hypothetical protein HanIR_Chr16g0810891 [Helianthus annuus]